MYPTSAGHAVHHAGAGHRVGEGGLFGSCNKEIVRECWLLLPSFREWVETLKLDRLSAVIANVLLCSFYPVIKNNLYTLYWTTHGWRGRARRRWCPPRWCSSTGGCGTATGTPRYLHTTCHVSRYCHVSRVTRLTVPRPAAHVDHVVGVEHAELLLTLRQALDPATAIYLVNRKKHCPGYANVRKNITSSVPLRFS